MNTDRPTDHAEIRLADGYVALVDANDWLWLSQWEWQVQINTTRNGYRYVYALRSNRSEGPHKRLLMHRAILQAPARSHVDHANHNTLDNRRCNIRLATPSDNSANRRVIRNLYGYKGIAYLGGRLPWIASAVKDKIRHTAGAHATAELAAAAYDELAIRLFGPFAKTNASIGREKFFARGQSQPLSPSTKANIGPRQGPAGGRCA